MTDAHVADKGRVDTTTYQQKAERHLWRHFAQMSADAEPPKIIVEGAGSYIVDSDGHRYLDGSSTLFCVNVGYSFGEEIGAAALAQYCELGYQSTWDSAHPRAIELAETLAALAPGDLDHVHLAATGGEAVEAAWKIARQHFLLQGQDRWKAIARMDAYHGTSLGALALNGAPSMRTPFEPMLAGAIRVRNTRRTDRPAGETEQEFTALLLDDLEQHIVAEDPATVAMVIIEPVQNRGGVLTPPAGYHAGVRALADKYGILVVADEVITGFGRLGAWFGSERFGLEPDIIVSAKGLSSAHAAISAVVANERVYEPFTRSGASFLHGNTFGGHPVMSAVALKNIEIMRRLDLPAQVCAREELLEQALRPLAELGVVGDVRGVGYFWGVELRGTRPDGDALTLEQRDRLFGPEAVQHPLERAGVRLRFASDLADPVLTISPPLVADVPEFTLLHDALEQVLTDVDKTRNEL